MKLFLTSCLLAAGLLLFATSSVLATKIIPMNPEKLAQASTAVVRGIVGGTESYWNAGHSKIFSETTIAVEETYKGSAGSQIRLIQLGGVVDGVQVTVHGALHWAQGEEVVLFLEPTQNGAFMVAGFSQGKFGVQRDPLTGRTFVNRPALEGVELVNDNGLDHADGGGGLARVPLDQFLSEALGSDYTPDNR